MNRASRSSSQESSVYVLGGLSKYTAGDNISGQLALGGGAEYQMSQWIVSGDILYGSYEVQSLDDYQMTQLGFHGSLKYKLMKKSSFQPFVGVGATYYHRGYKAQYLRSSNIEAVSSAALDVVGTLGMMYQVSSQVAIGVDFRYSFNLTNNNEALSLDSTELENFLNDSYTEFKPLESISQMQVLMKVHFRF